MGTRTIRCCVVLLGLLAAGPLTARQEKPLPLTAEQQEKLKERDRLNAEMPKLAQAKKYDEMLRTAERIVQLTKEARGEEDAEVVVFLDASAGLQRGLGEWEAAVRTREELLSLQIKRLGKDHWQVADARRAVQDAQQLVKMSPEDRRGVFEAEALTGRVVTLYGQGKYLEALELARRALDVTRKALGENHPLLAYSLNNLGNVLTALGKPAEALPYYQRALDMYQKLYPDKEYPNGHPVLARSLDDLGVVLSELGKPAEALPYYKRALDMCQKLYPEKQHPNGHPYVAYSLNNLGNVLQTLGKPAEALPYYQRALDMYQKLCPEKDYPNGHPNLAGSLNNLGGVLHALGKTAEALPHLERALDMCQKLYPEKDYPKGDPLLASSLNCLGPVLAALGKPAEALPHLERALDMCQKLYPEKQHPNGHPHLALSLMSLGSVLKALGKPAEALPHLERAREMYQKLYPEKDHPNGHPNLAHSLENLGSVLHALGKPAEALPHLEHALDMYQKLYPEKDHPNGHPDLARSLNNLGSVLSALGKPAEALPHLERALDMCQKLYPEKDYPNGQPHLAESLNNLGLVLQAEGKPAEALPHLKLALAMRQKLYPEKDHPNGHPHLARSLNNLGGVLQALGKPAEALPYHERALAMCQTLGDVNSATLSEQEALGYVQSLPHLLTPYLSLSRDLASADADVYARLWPAKAAVARVLQHRLLGARIQQHGDADTRKLWAELLDTQDAIAALLRQTPRADEQDARDRRLRLLTDQKQRLERDLNRLLPELPRQRDLDKLGPTDLAKALPRDTAFVDLYRYTYVEKGKKPLPSYVAFVLSPGKSVRRIELGPAADFDRPLRRWLEAIAEGKDSPDDSALLRKRLWDRIAERLPADVKAVLVCPDGDLARLPWAALPGERPGSVLLEERLVALIPSGPYLLEQLLHPPRYPDGPDKLLTVGAVAFGPKNADATRFWTELKASGPEAEQVGKLGGDRGVVRLSGKEATPARVLEELPKVRYAHLATHGFFDESSLTEEKKRQAAFSDRLKGYQFVMGRVTEQGGVGARNPLGYTGLVLAGANDPTKAGADEGIATGERLVRADLRGLKLAVLSACDTGLGELTEGEGVLGLQRAFHLAGCPQVVASLWEVNDPATAALMAKFYHELWENKQPPLEALRRAQLTIYRMPEAVELLAKGDRGAPLYKKALESKPEDLPRAKEGNTEAKRAPIKLWAAFVLSGMGR
jgi:tetratricopeptide (TPR) repeat protein/CHAT domain-containing protein